MKMINLAKSSISIYQSFKLFTFTVVVGTLFILIPNYAQGLQTTPMESSNNDGNTLFQLKDAIEEEFSENKQDIKKELIYYLNNGMHKRALETINAFPPSQKNDTEIMGIKAAVLIGKGDFGSAMSEYDKLKNQENVSVQSFSLITNMLLVKKKPFAAMKVCQSGLMRNINSARLLYQMGHAYDLVGKPKIALIYYQAALNANDISHEINRTKIKISIAVAHYKLNDYENAEKTLSIENAEGYDAEIRSMIKAKFNASKGDINKALSVLENRGNSPKYIELNLTKAQLLILNREPRKAINLLNEMDKVLLKSDLADILMLTKSLAFLVDKKPSESLRILNSISHPDKIKHFHILKAISYLSMNNKTETVKEMKQGPLPYSEIASLSGFEKLLSQPSMGPDIGLAFFCLDQKFYKEALSIAKRNSNDSKNNILLSFITAESYLLSEQYSLAINELIKINKTFKNSYAIRFYLSQAYGKAGMINEAGEAYKSLTNERPDFIMANFVYGKLLEKLGQWSHAKENYENGLNFEPDSPSLQMSLAWTLANLNEFDNLNRLLRIIEKNEKIAPLSIIHLKGWLAFKTDNFDEAEKLLKKAIEKAPGNPEICYHLGMTMIQTGKQDTAKNLLKQSFLFEKQRKLYKDSIPNALL
ncbi:MAG: tetratricopeptide repeat protein [Desulfobacter sp.]|nr:MAG: tetratricopeptide repeat protein [Desulfobacter sp.]